MRFTLDTERIARCSSGSHGYMGYVFTVIPEGWA
jgi:hypothetical protein